MTADDSTPWPTRRQMLQLGAATLTAVDGVVAAGGLTAAGPAMAQGAGTSCASYIVKRLKQYGANVLFGIPGATCDAMFAAAHAGGMEIVTTASDFEAGYAADGYARVTGLSAVSVTYGVGTMSLIGTISGAYVEHSPVVVISGGPSADDLAIQRKYGTLFSHSNGRERTDLAMFREVTVYAQRAEKAADVPGIVDRGIEAALKSKRPVYIEIAKDVWDAPCQAPVGALSVSNQPSGEEARLARDIVARLRRAQRPAVLIGVEVSRRDLSSQVADLVTGLRLPWATTLLGKSAIAETTRGFVGVYGGEHAPPSVVRTIEGADALLAIGCVFGRQYRKLVTSSNAALVSVSGDGVRFGSTASVAADLATVVAEVSRAGWAAAPAVADSVRLQDLSFEARRQSLARRTRAASTQADVGLTYDETMSAISAFLDDGFVVVTDTSLSMYPAADLKVAGPRSFVCNSVWQSIGYSLGAAVGVGIAQSRRPLVICGDGGFQTSAQSLSTMAERRLRAIVIVLDNGEHGIEQWLLDADYFSDRATPLKPYLKLNRWDYAELARAMGFKTASTVANRDELRVALLSARGAAGPVLIAAKILPRDLPTGLG